MTDVFHEGEIAVQTRAGVRDRAAKVGNGIHTAIPPAAQEFLSQREFAILGGRDPHGAVWASLLTGPAGFLRTPDERTLDIAAALPPDDPLAVLGTPSVGLLAIDPTTRRRMRLNGTMTPAEHGLRIHAQEVYANCPKYIQKREPSGTAGDTPLAAQRSPELTPRQQEWLRRVDTFFIASAAKGSADASHRGGSPGFVTVSGPRTLSWPDYVGNAMFNTLGNLALDPRCGLLAVDFETGDTLQVTGTAEIRWQDTQASVVLTITEAVERPRALPTRLRLLEYSPFNPA